MLAGPGNSWVSTAKKMLFGYVKIDSVAGPSEVLIIADKTASPAYIAADMLSQAEHAPSGGAILFTDSKTLAKNVIDKLDEQLGFLSKKTQTLDIIKKYSAVAVFKSIANCVEWANKFATEHLEIQCGRNSGKIAAKIKNAGAVFVGEYTPVATGDYFAGPSHTLPTGGCARFASALTSNDFIKSSSIIEYNIQTLKKNKDDIIRLAEAEGLDAHSNSVKIRFKNKKQ
jgi:histidinol dehydrogenase